MKSRGPVIRYAVASRPAECFRILGIVADGTIRCRRTAEIEIEYVRLPPGTAGRRHFFCGQCFEELWRSEPGLLQEIFDQGEVFH